MRSERRVCLVLGSPDCHVADEQKAAFKKAAGASGGQDECQVRLKGREGDYWMGTEIGMLGGCGFQGQVTAGDGSDKQGKMGAGYNNLRRKKKKQPCKVGREEEGSSSNRPELAVLFLALRDTLIEKLLLFLCDNQSLLKAVNRWIGEGGKATLVGAPGCWLECNDDLMLVEAWNAATEEFSEDWPSTTVHQIQGARITLSVSYDQKDWGAMQEWIAFMPYMA